VATTLPPATEGKSGLGRRLGAAGLWLLVLNGMVGAGIFGIPAEAARLAGAWSPALFLLTAVLVAPVLLCFSQLASGTRESGGPARYVQIAFGTQAGFQTGWALYIARLTAFAANLSLMLAAIAHFLPSLGEGPARIVALAAIVGVVATLNIVGVSWAMRSLGALTVAKLLPLLLLVALGLSQLPAAPATVALLPAEGLALGPALLLMVYAFVGFESGLIPGGEARHPARDMPRALLGALLLCGLLYAGLQWLCLRFVPELATQTRPLVALGEALLGPWGASLVLATIIASVGGNLLSSMFAVPRVTHSLAEQGLLPRPLAAVSVRFRTPWASVLLYAVLAWALAATGSFVLLAAMSVLVRLLMYLACLASMPAVDRQGPPDRWRLPGGPAVALLAAGVCLALLSQVGLPAVLGTAGLLACGSVLYALARWRRPPTPVA
jgi:amino acid transporter